jgi:Flp pilus assembly pilin Flp
MTEMSSTYLKYGLRKLFREEGQTLVEYGLVLLLVSISLLLVLVAFQGAVAGLFDAISSTVSGLV